MQEDTSVMSNYNRLPIHVEVMYLIIHPYSIGIWFKVPNKLIKIRHMPLLILSPFAFIINDMKPQQSILFDLMLRSNSQSFAVQRDGASIPSPFEMTFITVRGTRQMNPWRWRG